MGILSARFRDVPLVVQNAVQLFFFITPILWKPENLSGRDWIYLLNPFYYLIEIMRRPLLGGGYAAEVWGPVLVFTAINALVAIALFARFRRRIAYWL